jgi:hypothetical protein
MVPSISPKRRRRIERGAPSGDGVERAVGFSEVVESHEAHARAIGVVLRPAAGELHPPWGGRAVQDPGSNRPCLAGLLR